MKLRLAITESNGYLGQTLISRLGSDPDCEFILGLDIRSRPYPYIPRVEYIRFDLTKPWGELAEFFRSRGINTAVHMAWQFDPIHDTKRQREIDVEGSRNFFLAAEAAGLRRVIYTSSTSAYVNPRNPSGPPFLTEDTPLTAHYLDAKHEAEVEQIGQEFMARHPETQVLVLRSTIVLGRRSENMVSKMLDWPWRSFPWMFHVSRADPPLQFISEEDVGDILYRAVKSDVYGIFNVTGDGVVRYSEIVRAAGKKPLEVPADLLYLMAAALWALHLSPFPAGLLDLIRYPWVADNSRLKTVFGYTPRLNSREALDSFLAFRQGRRA